MLDVLVVSIDIALLLVEILGEAGSSEAKRPWEDRPVTSRGWSLPRGSNSHACSVDLSQSSLKACLFVRPGPWNFGTASCRAYTKDLILAQWLRSSVKGFTRNSMF